MSTLSLSYSHSLRQSIAKTVTADQDRQPHLGAGRAALHNRRVLAVGSTDERRAVRRLSPPPELRLIDGTLDSRLESNQDEEVMRTVRTHSRLVHNLVSCLCGDEATSVFVPKPSSALQSCLVIHAVSNDMSVGRIGRQLERQLAGQGVSWKESCQDRTCGAGCEAARARRK